MVRAQAPARQLRWCGLTEQCAQPRMQTKGGWKEASGFLFNGARRLPPRATACSASPPTSICPFHIDSVKADWVQTRILIPSSLEFISIIRSLSGFVHRIKEKIYLAQVTSEFLNPWTQRSEEIKNFMSTSDNLLRVMGHKGNKPRGQTVAYKNGAGHLSRDLARHWLKRRWSNEYVSNTDSVGQG